jgi:hypothetical protein
MTQFNTNPLTDKEQDRFRYLTASTKEETTPDWAEALTEARIALRELEDGFPASDKEKVQAAHKRLTIAARRMRMFMLLRGVEPLV